METIRDNGQVFVKATALAKKYKYTTDYIGQLCRASKVEAKLVGRAWFVDEESLKQHINDRTFSARSSEIVINKGLVSDRQNNSVVARPVHSVLRKNIQRQVNYNNSMPQSYNFLTRNGERTSTYLSDDGELAPESIEIKPRIITNNEENHYVTQEEKSIKLKIAVSEKKAKKLEFEPLPEVSLRGNLTILSLDAEDNFPLSKPVSADDLSFTPQSVTALKATIVPRYHQKNPMSMSQLKSRRPVADVEYVESEDDFTVDAVESEQIVFKSTVATTGDLKKQSRLAFGPRAVFVCFIFSSVVCFFLLGLVSVMESDGIESKKSVIFNLAAVAESFDKLSKSY